jgi:hypothetical protein
MQQEKINNVFAQWLAAYEEQLILVIQGKPARTEDPSESFAPASSGAPVEVTPE